MQQRAKEVDCAEEISGGSWYPLGRSSFSSGGGRGVITCDRLRLSEEIVHKVRRVVSRRGVFGVRWLVGGGRDKGFYENGDGGVDVRDGSAEVGAYAGTFVGEEEGGGGGCKGVLDCCFEGGEARGGYGG